MNTPGKKQTDGQRVKAPLRERGAKFLRQLLHHLTCSAVWTFPYDARCLHPDCGNWLDNQRIP